MNVNIINMSAIVKKKHGKFINCFRFIKVRKNLAASEYVCDKLFYSADKYQSVWQLV